MLSAEAIPDPTTPTIPATRATINTRIANNVLHLFLLKKAPPSNCSEREALLL